MRTVERSEMAERDLEEIFEQLEEFSPNASDVFKAELKRICRLLVSQPGLGRPRESLGSGLRSIMVSRYLLFFRATADCIFIVRIVYATRDLNQIEWPMQ